MATGVARLAVAIVAASGMLAIAGPPGPTHYTGPPFPDLASIASGDLNDDGADDFAIGGRGACPLDRIALFLRDPALPFAFHRGRTLYAGTGTLDVKFADVDGDGHLDVVAGGSDGVCGGNIGAVGVFFREIDGSYTRRLFRAGDEVYRVAAADFDGDGRSDIAAITTWDLMLLRADPGNPRGLSRRHIAHGNFKAMATGDVDGDAHPELAVSVRRPGHSAILLLRQEQDGTGSFQEIAELPTRRWSSAIALGALGPGAGHAVVFARGTYLWIVRNDPGGMGWLPAESIPTVGRGGHLWLGVRDMDLDGAVDLVIHRGRSDFYSPQHVEVRRQDPEHPGQFLAPVRRMTPLALSAALGDFDGDGLADIAIPSKPPHVVAQDPASPGQLLRARRARVHRAGSR